MPLIVEILCSKLCEPTNVGCISQKKWGMLTMKAKLSIFYNFIIFTQSINHNCIGRAKKAGGFKWEYVKDK